MGAVSIYIPEGEVLTSLFIDDFPLSSSNLEAATELGRLRLHNCGLYDVDLKYNRCLTDLDLSNNNLYNLTLAGIYGAYEKNVLSYFNASANNLSSVEIVVPQTLKGLNLSSNRIEEFSLKDFNNLLSLDLSDNLLSAIDLNYLGMAESIDSRTISSLPLWNAPLTMPTISIFPTIS